MRKDLLAQADLGRRDGVPKAACVLAEHDFQAGLKRLRPVPAPGAMPWKRQFDAAYNERMSALFRLAEP